MKSDIIKMKINHVSTIPDILNIETGILQINTDILNMKTATIKMKKKLTYTKTYQMALHMPVPNQELLKVAIEKLDQAEQVLRMEHDSSGARSPTWASMEPGGSPTPPLPDSAFTRQEYDNMLHAYRSVMSCGVPSRQ